MKYVFYLLFLSQIAQAQQSRFKEGESIYVWALSGLNIRKLPDAKSEKLAVLPYGTKVTVQPNEGMIVPYEVEEFKDFSIKGVWLLVKYGDKEGFVFDGYMSRLIAPKKEDFNSGTMSLNNYLSQNHRPITKKLIYKEKYVKDADYSLSHIPTIQKFSDGITVKDFGEGDGFVTTQYEIANASLFEGYILGKIYFFYEMNAKDLTFINGANSQRLVYNHPTENCSFNIEKKNNSIMIYGNCYC